MASIEMKEDDTKWSISEAGTHLVTMADYGLVLYIAHYRNGVKRLENGIIAVCIKCKVYFLLTRSLVKIYHSCLTFQLFNTLAHSICSLSPYIYLITKQLMPLDFIK